MFTIIFHEGDMIRAQQGRCRFHSQVWIWGLRLEHESSQRWEMAGRGSQALL